MLMTQAFVNGESLRTFCRENNISIAEAMQRREEQISDMSREDIREEMRKNLEVMRESVQVGLNERQESVSGFSGGEAELLYRHGKLNPYLGGISCRAAASAMAVVEVNCSMGRIVAAPTAGASGISSEKPAARRRAAISSFCCC